jgi:excisionase family DNA binding protein
MLGIELLTAKQAAEALQVSESLVRKEARRGTLPSVKVGRKSVRFSVEALRRWIAERERQA